MREIRTSGSPSGDWKRSRSKSGHAGLPPRQSSTLPDLPREGLSGGRCYLRLWMWSLYEPGGVSEGGGVALWRLEGVLGGLRAGRMGGIAGTGARGALGVHADCCSVGRQGRGRVVTKGAAKAPGAGSRAPRRARRRTDGRAGRTTTPAAP